MDKRPVPTVAIVQRFHCIMFLHYIFILSNSLLLCVCVCVCLCVHQLRNIVESLKAPPHEQKGDSFSPRGQHQHIYRDGTFMAPSLREIAKHSL